MAARIEGFARKVYVAAAKAPVVGGLMRRYTAKEGTMVSNILNKVLGTREVLARLELFAIRPFVSELPSPDAPRLIVRPQFFIEDIQGNSGIVEEVERKLNDLLFVPEARKELTDRRYEAAKKELFQAPGWPSHIQIGKSLVKKK